MPQDSTFHRHRRSFLLSLLGTAAGTAAICSLHETEAQQPPTSPRVPGEGSKGRQRALELVGAGKKLTITKLETILVKPRWLFLKVHTDAGIVGLGEPIVEGRAETCATAVQELSDYLVGKDPRSVVHHWQAMYRHAFYRGGPVLTSVVSGIDMALWDIKGKALGVPVYELLGGPTRTRMRVYAHVRTPEDVRRSKAGRFHRVQDRRVQGASRAVVETPGFVKKMAERFAALREAAGDEADIGIDFHGEISPQTANFRHRRWRRDRGRRRQRRGGHERRRQERRAPRERRALAGALEIGAGAEGARRGRQAPPEPEDAAGAAAAPAVKRARAGREAWSARRRRRAGRATPSTRPGSPSR